MKKIEKLVESFNESELNELASYFLNKDRKKALELYEKNAIKFGNKKAIHDLSCYTGDIKWLMKSAELGIATSMYNVGDYYEKLNNIEKAIEWYEKSIIAGHYPVIMHLYKLHDKNLYSYDKYKIIYKFCVENDKDKWYEDLEPKQEFIKLYQSLDDNCIICTEKLLKNISSISILECGHIYHSICIKKQIKCSICKKKIKTH